MSDEIKEYLDTLKEIVGEGKSKGTYGISFKNWKNLLDCITYLQQRIEYLERSNNRREENITSLQDECTELEQENERLKEENKRIFSKVNDDELLISNAMNYAEAQDYKSRCEKALEDIDKLISGTYSKDCTYYMQSDCCSKRLEIIRKDLKKEGK